MDTRLKKFKYSIFTKFLCWLICLISFCLSFLIAFQVLLNCIAVGPSKYFKEDPELTFFESDGFLNRLQNDFYYCLNLSSMNAEKLTAEFNSQKEAVTDDILNKFLDYKAGIIEEEPRYAVENWDDSYYEYDDEIDISLPEEYNTQVYINVNDPQSIQTAQKILVNAKGQEFLLYEGLVRDDAFQRYYEATGRPQVSDEFSTVVPDFSFAVQLNFSKEQAIESISEQYDAFVHQTVEQNYGYFLSNLSLLENRENLKYYVVDLDGNVYANIERIPQNLKNNERYILANKGNYEVKGFDVLSNFKLALDEKNYNVVCIYFDEAFNGDDIYKSYYETYNLARSERVIDIIIGFVIAFAIAVAFLVIWLMLNGHKANQNTLKMAFIDKLPTDIHLAAIGAIYCFLYICLHDALDFGTEYFDRFMFTNDFLVILGCAFVIFFMVFTEWLSSVVRIKKAGESIIKKSLIYLILYKLCSGIICIFRKLKNVFEYKPKAFKYQVIIGAVCYFFINAVFLPIAYLVQMNTAWDGAIFIILGLLLVAFNVLVLYFVVKYIKNLDKIIIASGEHKNVEFDDKKVDKSLVVLAKNLENSNEALDKAVAEAVKNEQMKTQLITNVSHDLKTPLTSLINYSDLLDKCGIEDEKAKEYIGVINNQSAKLKRLIEDLIEASKVSTGNVQLNKIKLNLSELAVQAIVEFSPDFEANKNEIKFTEPENAPVVYADSVKTYRIISNLFSNAKKYSAYNTRVYACVYEDDLYGYFEIKNISKEALNISPETLTERFVRGEESRTNEGNGLGLSIAKDLCTLQGGELVINIDGDLFKVIVKLPK